MGYRGKVNEQEKARALRRENRTLQDIADILGVGAPAVGASVHRARLFVRKRLAEFFESEDSGLARA